jgi:hypothetical protein
MGDAERLPQQSDLARRIMGFAYEAKCSTSRSGTDSEAKTPYGTTRHEYKRGPWQYTHEYSGLVQGGGSEIISLEGKPVWSMSYFGTAKKECFAFLSRVLLSPPTDCPIRGPKHYTDQNYEYFNLLEGRTFLNPELDFMQFFGIEYIIDRKDQELMFKGAYQGGIIEHDENAHPQLPERMEPKEVLRMHKPWRSTKATEDVHRMRIAGHKLIIRAEHLDNLVYNLGLELHKDNSTLRSVLSAFAEAVSIGLQHGVPLKEYIDKFTFTKFEPGGPVDHPNVKFCTSVLDCAFRVLAVEYLGMDDFAQAPKQPQKELSDEEASERVRAMMAPYCTDCGEITEPEGNGFKCLNCGEQSQAQKEGKPEEPKKDADDICSGCGSPVIRCGTVTKCLNCGNTSGA